MAIGSIGSSTVSTTVDTKRGGGKSAEARTKGTGTAETGTRTIADHVAALDDQEPIRSVSATRGTLVDTYL
jgi:hypothetical protein